MGSTHRISFNGEHFTARTGQTVLDAALASGVDVPHDCRAGRCGACLCRVDSGIVIGGETPSPQMVHLCQARVFSALSLSVEPGPPAVRTAAKIVGMTRLTRDVVELKILPKAPFAIWPGQYCRFTFRGYPPRAFSPTAPLDGAAGGKLLRLNIKRIENGHVTSSLGTRIRTGHSLVIEGPCGHAYLRRGDSRRLVLVGTGTGFAPIWAVADAALKENPQRAMTILTGARGIEGLYMAPALALASRFPNTTVIITTADAVHRHPSVQLGDPIDHLPSLAADDLVYAAGAPSLVEAVGRRARDAGATFYSDPFNADAGTQDWITRLVDWMRVG